MISNFKPIYLLGLGVLSISLAHMNVSMDFAGWLTCVPFLVYLRQTNGAKSKWLFLFGLIAAWSVCIAKIVSPPMPFAMIFLFSIPISLFHLPGYLVWDRYKDRSLGLLLFPCVMVIMEWIQYNFTPFASWGVAAYTQSHSLNIMQSASLFGMPGLSFIIYWVNCSIAEWIVKKSTTKLSFQIPLSVCLFLILFGSLRFELSKASSKEMIKVAAVGTDSQVGGFPLPSKESNDIVKHDLFKRTEMAALNGARLIVWNEAATFILPEEEMMWMDSLSALTKRLQVELVAAFIIPLSSKPLKYKNMYLFYDKYGNLRYTYNKHQPVPGEPAEKGQEVLKVFDISGVTTGAAICYDYDFPYLAKSYGDLNADLVAVPSSDWRGIDPLHSRMAAFRAVEQGHSIIRSTRFGLSAAISPYGEFLAQMSSYDSNDKVMMAHLPAQGVKTIYNLIGDTLVYLCFGFLFYFIYKQKNIIVKV